MPQPPGAAGAVPPPLDPRYAAQLDAVLADPLAPATTDVGDERGWLVARGVARLVEPFVTARPSDDADLARFAGVSGASAIALLERLDERHLADRQNAGPSLGTVVRAAAAHPDELEVHGYVVGPGRRDERLTAEGVDVYGLPLLDVRPDHDGQCQCELLWDGVVEHLGVDDAVTGPHEITRRINPWRPNETCWRLWWD